MSQFRKQSPIIHIPSFKESLISGEDLAMHYKSEGIKMPFVRSDNWYYYTDDRGWMSLLAYLVIKSNLYKKDRFDCEDYALKAMIKCAELFGLNTLRYTYGMTPYGAHGFNSFWAGDRFCLLEPNMGFIAQIGTPIFEWGENGYVPQLVLL